jgi:signal transduction histidine kinase
MIVISLMLLGVGVVAAWNIQAQQRTNSELIAGEVHSLFAAQELNSTMREIRYRLFQYVRTQNPMYLQDVDRLQSEAEKSLQQAQQLAQTDAERSLIGLIAANCRDFFAEYQRVQGPTFEGNRQARLEELLDGLSEGVIVRADEYMEMNGDVVDRANAISRHNSEQSRQGLLLIGLCGGAAGLIAGLAIARALSRSIVQFDISVRGAAGKLSQVTGPVIISGESGLGGLEATLRQMENHIGLLVQRLQQRELEILRAEQLAALGRLSAGIAHELRNPLMPIKTLVQAAIDRDDNHGLSRRQLHVIDEEIARMEQSIQAFLEFGRPPKLEKQPCDLRALVLQTVALVSSQAARQRVNVQHDLPPEPVVIEADAVHLRQVLLNLLLNALDALSEGGDIRIDLARAQAMPGADGSDTPVRTAVIRVADNGPGLTPEMLAAPFEPFVTTKTTGTGLGLTITRRIVEAHDGVVVAANQPEGGAVFTIYLPLAITSRTEHSQKRPLSDSVAASPSLAGRNTE